MSNLRLINDWRRFCKEVEDVPLSIFAEWVQLDQAKTRDDKLAQDGVTTIGSENDPGEADGDDP
jgi:hypothetical protein